MNNIYKMDMHRLTHSMVFYISLAFITIMAFALPYSGMALTMEGLMGVAGGAASGDDFMTSAMGAGVVYILIGIILSIFVCGDYSGGFGKNIFTTHSNPKDYIIGKLKAMAVTSGLLLAVYTVESIIFLFIFTGKVELSGGVAGLILFFLEKWLLSVAFSSVVLLVLVFTRNMAWGIVAAFLIATGGLAMGVSMLAEWTGFRWLNTIFSVAISGASSLCTLTVQPIVFLRVLLATVVWLVIAYIGSSRLLIKKDI